MTKITIKNVNAVSAVSFYNNELQKEDSIFNALSNFGKWVLRMNIKRISDIADEFQKARTELEESLQKDFFENEEKSIDDEQEQLDPATGEIVMVPVKRIKEEYIEEFDQARKEIIEKLDEILKAETEVSIDPIDFEAEFTNTKTDFDFKDLTVFMDTFEWMNDKNSKEE